MQKYTYLPTIPLEMPKKMGDCHHDSHPPMNQLQLECFFEIIPHQSTMNNLVFDILHWHIYSVYSSILIGDNICFVIYSLNALL